MRYIISDLEQFNKISSQMAALLKSGDKLLFEGEIGTGKTTFISNLTQTLQTEDLITSPTFTLINHYHCRNLSLYHLDLYRLNNVEDLYSIDIEHYLGDPDSVVLIEWADKLEDLVPDHYLKIHIYYKGPHQREIEFIPHGARYESLVSSLQSELNFSAV